MSARRLNYIIKKKGRKWYHAEHADKGWPAQILINEVSQNWTVGDVVEFYGTVDVQRNRYGTKVYVYPISEEEYLKTKKDEQMKYLSERYDKLKGWIAERAQNGGQISKLSEELIDIASELGKEEDARAYISEKQKESEHAYAWDVYKRYVHYALHDGQSPSSYEKLMNVIAAQAEKYEDINDDLQKIRDKLKARERDITRQFIREKMEDALRIAKEQISEYGSINDNIISRLESLPDDAQNQGFDDLVSWFVDEVSKLYENMENAWRKIYENMHPTTRRNVENLSPSLVWRISKQLDLASPYILVKNPSYWKYAKDRVRGAAFRDSGGQFIALIHSEDMSIYSQIEEYLESRTPLQILQECEVEEETLSDDELADMFPTSWNHYKKEFVATLSEMTNEEGHRYVAFDYISERINYTRSGANAELVVDGVPSTVGTLLAIYDGSHKHMVLSVYRREDDGWHLVGSGESGGGYYGGGVRGALRSIIDEAITREIDTLLEPEEMEL